jgi:hypothetical protein
LLRRNYRRSDWVFIPVPAPSRRGAAHASEHRRTHPQVHALEGTGTPRAQSGIGSSVRPCPETDGWLPLLTFPRVMIALDSPWEVGNWGSGSPWRTPTLPCWVERSTGPMSPEPASAPSRTYWPRRTSSPTGGGPTCALRRSKRCDADRRQRPRIPTMGSTRAVHQPASGVPLPGEFAGL